MKKSILVFTFAALSFLAFNFSASAQGRTVEPKIQRDPVLEQDMMKNLEAARQYFVTKKAYRAVLMRCDEIQAGYPEFSRYDEVLYLMGTSGFYLSEGKGKQKIDLAKIISEEDKKRYQPERLREEAIGNLNLLVEKFPNSEFTEKAKKTLLEIDKK